MSSVHEFAVSPKAKPKPPLAIGAGPLGTRVVYEVAESAPNPVRRRKR